MPMPGTLFVVATPIGNLEDITLRALRVLREVPLIAAEDTRRTAGLLAHFGIETPTTSFHAHNEEAKAARLLDRLRGGENLALVSDAGTPGISDPGSRLVRAAIESGLPVQAVPGASAVLTALVASGLPTDQFVFLGFPPQRSKDRKTWLLGVAAETRTLVVYEAPHRIRQSLEDMLEVLGDRSISVGRELTKVHEQLVNGPISTVLSDLTELRGEFTVVIHGAIPEPVVARPLPPADQLLVEFGEITKTMGGSRREAVKALAARYHSSPKVLYTALEQAKAGRAGLTGSDPIC